MMGGNEVFQATHREQALGKGIGAAHKAQQRWVMLDQRFRRQFGHICGEYFSSLLGQLRALTPILSAAFGAI
jgi:hypothetical protein